MATINTLWTSDENYRVLRSMIVESALPKEEKDTMIRYLLALAKENRRMQRLINDAAAEAGNIEEILRDGK